MSRRFTVMGALALVALVVPSVAHADTTDPFSRQPAELQRQVRLAAAKPIIQQAKTGDPQVRIYSPAGTYPTRHGVILVTPDFFKGLIPTGHSAFVDSASQVIESTSKGVVRGPNDWRTSRSQVYAVTPTATTGSQDSTAVDWAIRQLGKPYNYNYFDRDTRSKFYCSQLVWAAYRDNFNIDLDTWAFGAAVHPMELVNTDKTTLLYRKK